MLKATLLASALSLGLAVPAQASDLKRNHEVTQPSRPALPAEVVTVETPRRNTGGVILADAVGGMLLGAAAGGGVSLYNHYNNADGSWGDWQRNVAIGAGIGLGVGLLFGAIDASNGDRTFTGPVADRRATGFAPPTAVYGAKF
jgi:hypothetical protein